MSYNSPVIKKMTVELFQTEIPVEDFSKYAVECFLEASYSGVLEKLSKSNFRDLNKMACVFEVDWLIEKCFEYFQKLTESVREDNFEDQLFLFDEAMFVMDKRKKRRLIDIVIKQFASLATCTQHFVTQFLKDVSSCPKKKLEVIMEMAADQENILVEAILNNLENNECTAIDENSRFMIERLSFRSSISSSECAYQRLFEKLEEIENPSTEDFRLIMRALKQYNKALKEINTSIACTALPNKRALKNTNTAIPYAALPNLFHDFKQVKNVKNLEALTNFLIESPLVINSYMFYDTVYSWLFEKRIDMYTPFVCISVNFVKVFRDHIHDRGWKTIDLEYLDQIIIDPCLSGLNDKVKISPNLATYKFIDHRIPSIYDYTAEELFARDHDIKFKYKQESIRNCSKEGDCGFILRVTAATGKDDDSFNIELVLDPNLYPDDDIHFHRESHRLANKLHFTIDVTDCRGNTLNNRPVTWCSKPQLDETNKYWNWGTELFDKIDDDKIYDDKIDDDKIDDDKIDDDKIDDGSAPPGYVLYNFAYVHGNTAKIRPVVYYTG